MRKNFLYQRWKNILYASLFLLLTVSTAITSVSASPAQLHVEPPSATIEAVGENVTITLNATDVEDYYGCDFVLYWSRTTLNATAVTDHGPGTIVDALGLTSAQHMFSATIINDFNATNGKLEFSETFVYGQGAPTFNGSGTVARITFEGLTEGVSALTFDPDWTFWYSLTFIGGTPIPTEQTFTELPTGEITVIPEFPAAIAMSLLLITTLAAGFLGKMVWSRKRKDALTAE